MPAEGGRAELSKERIRLRRDTAEGVAVLRGKRRSAEESVPPGEDGIKPGLSQGVNGRVYLRKSPSAKGEDVIKGSGDALCRPLMSDCQGA
ncbi:hypothetical protein ACOMHN_056227 [Nucella lapillus]